MIVKKIDASVIADMVNASGYTYYGARAKAWDGSGCSRIYFGSFYVTIESSGEVHANKSGKARAQTIGYTAVEAVQSAVDQHHMCR